MSRAGLVRRRLFFAVVPAWAAAALLLSAGISARAASVSPAWGVYVAGVPSVLPAGTGHHGRFIVIVENTGGAPSEGGGVLHDVLPKGLSARQAVLNGCSGEGADEVECPLPEGMAPGQFMAVYVEFESTASLAPGSTLTNSARVTGGGGVEASEQSSIRTREVGEVGPGPGGIAGFSMSATSLLGEPSSQAAGHPNLFNVSAFFNDQFPEEVADPMRPAEAVRDVVFYLPLGVLGDARIAEQCPPSLVEVGPETTGCPRGSKVGSIMPIVLNSGFAVEHGLYNVTPEKGYVAEFAFTSNGLTFLSYASVVKRDGTYMVRISTPGVPVSSWLIGFAAATYGDLKETLAGQEGGEPFDRGAYLTNPSDCGESQQAREGSVAMDTWEHPDPQMPHRASSMVYPTLGGCGLLGIAAGLSVTPETNEVDRPTGVEVGVEVPQAPNDFTRLGTPPVKDTVVALPAGVTVSPSSANGLEACPASGPGGFDMEGEESEETAPDGLKRPAVGHCPFASQIATVRATTPLLDEELTGRMFLATPECGQGEQGCSGRDAEEGKLVGLDMEVIGQNSGIVVKLKGHASIQQGTGRITASFENLPQFPFSRLSVMTKQGPRAPLENAQSCQTSLSTATITSWSPPTPPATPSDPYTTSWDGGGGACPTSPPFAPNLTAGTTNPQAASTSPFVLSLAREDREQDVGTLSTTLPEGLLAYLSRVPRCPEPQASEDSLTACPAASQIGTTTVAVGPGSNPYYQTGKVFLTGPYNGAPFGLSVVVPAVAGPFNLGDVHVRARITVDPHTAQAAATSDPLPQELDGIPLRLRLLDVTLTNGEFVLNATGCSKTSIAGTVTSPGGAAAAVSSPYAAANCKDLHFQPTFTISTEAKATKARGTGVRVKIAFPSGKQSNIAKVVVELPKQLPVRLATLQKACPSATFEANPASCPAASVVGTAIAHTPILTRPATGPVYLVSYGNAKFPDVVFVLQSEGVTVDVDGQSFVSKSGALKATFAAVPDVPISKFETVLPPGPFSQFTSVTTSGKARGSQCGEKLVAPVRLTAHNGAQVTEKVHLAITGCRGHRGRRKRG